ncbi:MAG: Ig-like domain-containing protein [Gammaproteobacteria bacterium]|nr:Ig-like domain-containing protein [Gammaproteobacteria bacterium]
MIVRGIRLLLRAGLATGIAACARPQAPQGGVLPEVPLRAVETRPAHLSIVAPFDDPVEIRFAQVVSERLTQGSLADAVVVSPRTGEVLVERSGDRITVSMEGGFRDGTLYRITVLPWLQDRYQNTMEFPFDLLFSTGPDFEPNLVAGLASDGLTFEPVGEYRVDARVEGREEHLSALADTAGIFSFPFLPSDAYTLVAYEDTNRDGEPGFNEIQDSVRVSVAPGDTLVLADFLLLEPDSTAAVLTEATAVDSVAVRLTFDDYLDPEAPLDGVEATVTVAEGGGALDIAEVLHLVEWEAREPAAPPDSAAQQDAPSDSTDVQDAVPLPDSVAAEDLGGDPAADQAVPPDSAVAPADEGPTLPARELVLLLSAALVPEEIYEVDVGGVTNVNDLSGGGGVVELSVPAAPPPSDPPSVPPSGDPAADTTAAPGAAAPPDTAAVP